jgi:hypothetical protein
MRNKKPRKNPTALAFTVHGCKLDRQEINERVMDGFAQFCPGNSVDDLQADVLRHLEFCKIMAHRLGMSETGLPLIGRLLQNMRKRGNLNRHDRRTRSRHGPKLPPMTKRAPRPKGGSPQLSAPM